MSHEQIDILRDKIVTQAQADIQTEPLQTIFSVFSAHPGKLGFVGGAVRDWCLDKHPEDWDLLWQGELAILVEALETAGINTRLRPEYLTLTCNVHGHDIDIAVTRTDVYPIPGGKPTISIASLTLDLKRRDFTANAVAAFVNNNNVSVIDLMGGLGDISGQNLRPLAPETLLEDPVRLLRGARYLHRLKWKPAGDWALGLAEGARPETWRGIEHGRVWRELRLLADEAEAPAMYQQLSDWRIDSALFNRPFSPALIDQLQQWRQFHGPEPSGTGRNWLIDLAHIEQHIPEILDYVDTHWPPPQDEINRFRKLGNGKKTAPDGHWHRKGLAL